jgi:ribonucleoside-diphosphate reductase alpha chain
MSEKDLSVSVLSDITVHMKYAKYLPELKRRETWNEICDRYETMMKRKYEHVPTAKEFMEVPMQMVRNKKILPSMRALQFAGPAIEKNEARIYNCAYLPVEDYTAFSETMFLLLGGTGVGYSVQYHHVDKLPEIRKPRKTRKYLIGDSIEGWADAVKALMKSFFGVTQSRPIFNYDDIRPKGANLVTAGGKAPGPGPLRICLNEILGILEAKEDGFKLTTVEAHDIQCHIANAVLAGGIRRANNSAVILRHRITKGEFMELWKKIEDSGSGEPGMYFSNDHDWGTNPCCEIALRPYQFCNLCEVNVSDIEDQTDLEDRVTGASILGTLQAGFTDLHYLRSIWRTTTEKDALVGVGMTGIGSGVILNYDLEKAADVAKRVNADIAKALGINEAARVTTVKPSGTSSIVLGTSSGVHAWHAPYYMRRVRIGKNEALYTYLSIRHPELVEDEHFRPDTQAVIGIPQKAPDGAITRNESALDLLERTKLFNLEWVRNGHRSGMNTNNVSATVSMKPEDWPTSGEWMWENRNNFNGLSVLPADNGSYFQAPFEDIDKTTYDKLIGKVTSIDLTEVFEDEDNTDLAGEAACGAGGCEVK